MSVKEVLVSSADSEMRLDKFLSRQLGGVPVALLRKWLRTGQVRVNGKRAKPEQRLIENDKVRIPPFIKEEVSEEKGQIPNALSRIKQMMIAETKDYMILNKPFGLATQGGTNVKESLDDLLASAYPQARPRLTHRLDKDTTGIIIVAKNAKAATNITGMFQGRRIHKTYIAVAIGDIRGTEGVINIPLGKRGAAGGTEKTVADEEGGLSATTNYKVLDKAGKIVLLELKPESGRKHQIRAHLAYVGCPVIGDGKYGGSKAFMNGMSNNLHLHSSRVKFKWNEQPVEYVAPLPKHMKESLKFIGLQQG